MDANANANPIVPSRPVADPLRINRCPRVLHIAIGFLLLVNLFLSVLIMITHDPEDAKYIAAIVIAALMPCIQVTSREMFRRLDVACHPETFSWIAAYPYFVIGAVYPICLYLSKPHWVVIGGWIMLAIHGLTTALLYYDYLLEKDFCHKSVHPFPPGTEENV